MTASPTFQPAWWLPNPHLQTLWSPFFRRGPTLERQRERLWLADGDFIDLDWAGPHDAETRWCWRCTAHRVILVALHPRSAARPAGARLGQRGAELARLLGEPNRLPRGYHSGVSDDPRGGRAPARQAPQAPLYAVGYSLGGNVLLKYLGETVGMPAARRRRGVGAVRWTSAPTHRPGLFPGLHQAHFMKAMLAYVQDKQRLFGEQGRRKAGRLQRLGPWRACAPSGTSTAGSPRAARFASQGLLSARVQPLLLPDIRTRA